MGTQYRQLIVEERGEIHRLLADGKSGRAIGALLGRPTATVSRELRRNGHSSEFQIRDYQAAVPQSQIANHKSKILC
jgi:IS30 family transposase